MTDEELFLRSRGPTGPDHYRQLKAENEAGRPTQVTAQEQQPSAVEIYEKRWKAFEDSVAAQNLEIDERRRMGRMSGWEAHWAKTDAEQKAGDHFDQLEREDKALQLQAERVVPLAQEHAQVLAQQAADLSGVRSRFEATGEEVLATDRDFHPGGNQFAYEKKRHEEALKEHRGIGDPLKIEERAAATELQLFTREQAHLEKEILNESDLTKRHDLTMKKDIRAADYLAYTAGRIVEQNERLTGDSLNEIGETYRVRAEEYQKEGERLRKEYRDHAVLSDKSREAATAKSQGHVTDREARFEAFEKESQSAQPTQSRTVGRTGMT